MMRIWSVLGIGLVAGLSGCAGHKECFLKRPLASPQSACATKPKKECFLKKLIQCKKCGKSRLMASPQSWSSPQSVALSQATSVQCPCGRVVSMTTGQVLTPAAGSDEAPPPPLIETRPATGTTPPAGTTTPSGAKPGPSGMNEPAGSDPLNVRTSALLGDDAAQPPAGLRETVARVDGDSSEAAAPADGNGLKAESVPTAIPAAIEPTPGPLPSPPNPAMAPPIEPSRPSPSTSSIEPKRARRLDRTDAVGDLAFPVAYYEEEGSSRRPVPATTTREEARPKRVSILGRIARRLRGEPATGPDSGSARREARDVAEQGEGVRSVTLDRLDEAPER